MDKSSPTVIVGIGNDFRSDDGVGLQVARLVRDKAGDDMTVVEGIADGYALLEKWTESSKVVVIDCATSGAEPGCVFVFDALNENIPADLFDGLSTHSISLVQAIELARTLGRLPASLTVYGIEGKDFSSGLGLSGKVEEAAVEVAERITQDSKHHP